MTHAVSDCRPVDLAYLVAELKAAGVTAAKLEFGGNASQLVMVERPGVADTPACGAPPGGPGPEAPPRAGREIPPDRFAATGITPGDVHEAMAQAEAERQAARLEQETPGPEAQHDASKSR